MNKSDEFLKNIKKKKASLIVGTIILVICLAFEGLFYMDMKETKANPTPMIEATDTMKYSSLKVESLTDYIATYKEDGTELEKIYFIYDGTYVYLSNLSADSLTKVQPLLDYAYSEDEDAVKPEPVTIYGYTKSIPDDLKTIAIDAYNEIFENKIDPDTFSNYLGYYYLNTIDTPESEFISLSIFIGVFAIVGIVCLFVYYKNTKRTKNYLSLYEHQMERIKNEINSVETVFNKQAKVYMTPSYLISYANGLEIFEYKDVIWIYPHEFRQNGIVTQKSIYVVTRDSKVHVVARMSASKKKNIVFDELYHSLLIKAPDALQGFTKENQDKAKELYVKK